MSSSPPVFGSCSWRPRPVLSACWMRCCCLKQGDALLCMMRVPAIVGPWSEATAAVSPVHSFVVGLVNVQNSWQHFSPAGCYGLKFIIFVITKVFGSKHRRQTHVVACRKPYQGVNFIIAHDGFTLHDLVAYNGKHNEANGEQNRDGSNDNFSWNCGQEGETSDAGVNALRQRQMRNMMLALMVSQGTPMVLMGPPSSCLPCTMFTTLQTSSGVMYIQLQQSCNAAWFKASRVQLSIALASVMHGVSNCTKHHISLYRACA